MEHSGQDTTLNDKINNDETKSSDKEDPPTNLEEEHNQALKKVLGPLMAEFKTTKRISKYSAH